MTTPERPASPVPPFDLTGKVAVVTGGSRGIGRAIAEGLARAGADVVIASRKLEACETAAAEIEKATARRALPVQFHAGRWEDSEHLVDAVYGEFGRCDVLVNNAGMSPAYDDLASVTEELYDKVHAVNAKGPFRLSVLMGRRMAAAEDGGSIINVSSVGSWRPTPVDLPYGMAKAALNALTLALAGAWAPKVRANLVLPSATETDLTAAWPPETKSRIADSNPMKRLARPEDFAGVCVFLASEAAGYVNGAQVPVDGGMYRTL
jgi:NAD(P)-dependent dehydrogenase (short-subunit alcohol dehydrogenase family)